jgi:hypothetical protein
MNHHQVATQISAPAPCLQSTTSHGREWDSAYLTAHKSFFVQLVRSWITQKSPAELMAETCSISHCLTTSSLHCTVIITYRSWHTEQSYKFRQAHKTALGKFSNTFHSGQYQGRQSPVGTVTIQDTSGSQSASLPLRGLVRQVHVFVCDVSQPMKTASTHMANKNTSTPRRRVLVNKLKWFSAGLYIPHILLTRAFVIAFTTARPCLQPCQSSPRSLIPLH